MSQPLILAHETRAAVELREALREHMLAWDDDETLLRDMIEGSTSLVEAIRATMERLEYLEDDVTAADARIKQLQMRKGSREMSIERLKAALLRAIERSGLSPFREPGRYTLTAARAPQKLVIDGDPAELPADYVKVTVEAKRAELKKALRDGVAIPDVRLVDGGTHLVIRRG